MQGKPWGISTPVWESLPNVHPIHCLLIHSSGWCCVYVCWSVSWGCVIRYACCPNQQSANTPHCAVPLKVWWISLWCLKTLQPATQTDSQHHERGLCFCSLPLQSSSRPITIEQTLQCCKFCNAIHAVSGWRWAVIWSAQRGYFYSRQFNSLKLFSQIPEAINKQELLIWT